MVLTTHTAPLEKKACIQKVYGGTIMCIIMFEAIAVTFKYSFQSYSRWCGHFF